MRFFGDTNYTPIARPLAKSSTLARVGGALKSATAVVDEKSAARELDAERRQAAGATSLLSTIHTVAPIESVRSADALANTLVPHDQWPRVTVVF